MCASAYSYVSFLLGARRAAGNVFVANDDNLEKEERGSLLPPRLLIFQLMCWLRAGGVSARRGS